MVEAAAQGQYFNKGLGLKKQVAGRLSEDYTCGLVKRLIFSNGGV